MNFRLLRITINVLIINNTHTFSNIFLGNQTSL